ncbi:MAG: response regulator transcription factor [Inquilinus sp.]|nr:response regulator transcription factor [Inquilinus sp.]
MRVLLVEDDRDLAAQIAEALRGDNFAVDIAEDGPEALALGSEEAFDAVILDPGLPGMDGISVLRRWREKGLRMPVIVLTASRREVADMKDAVKAGATNYLTKPVDLELLLDWVRGVANSAGPNVRQPVLEAGPLRMDTLAMRVWFDGGPVRLTPTEFRLLHYLLVNRQRPVAADELVQHNFDGASAKTSNEIPVYISRLRDKLGRATIETVLGYGYRLACGDE